MMITNKQIIETLQLQNLTEEDKATRHILGRLYGPIATSNEGTRNGRLYNKTLWEKALNDDLFAEKLKTKSLFLELGHPVDREETDMTKVCACIPEMPKIVNGDLYAYVDVLDTPNGKILKTLCDYGFVPGISSRGSGDIMSNNEVDPETFYLETWDIVALPAVKNARLAMCESLETKNNKLKKVLRESYDKASDEDKKIMEETLKDLDLDISTDDDISDKVLVENDEQDTENAGMLNEIDAEDEVLDTEIAVDDSADTDETEEAGFNKDSETTDISDLKDLAADKDIDAEEIADENEKLADEDPEAEEESKIDDTDIYTVGDLVDELKDFDNKFDIEFKPIVIDGTEYEIKMLSFDDSNDGKVIVEIDYTATERDNKDEEEVEVNDEAEPIIDETDNKALEAEEKEADDFGADEVVESLKEMIRQKGLLEQEIKSLRGLKAVSDTEVKELKEDLEKYKSAFARTSELASKAKQATIEVKSLTEQLNSKEQEIAKLQENNSIRLNESVDAAKAKIKSLSNQLNESAEKLSAQEQTFKGKLNESIKVAKQYKEKYTEALNKYVSFRATMLGVRPADIINKLHENYSFENIDAVCDNILTESTSFNKFNLGSSPRVKITEQKTINKSNAYDINDLSDLYELAGLTD